MKKKFVLPLAALSLMVGLAGCDKGGPVTPDASGSAGASTSKSTAASSKMEQIKVTNAEGKTSASVVIGNTIQLTADKDGVTWTSSNESIATVANGLVTTKALGSVKITAKKEGFKDGSFNIRKAGDWYFKGSFDYSNITGGYDSETGVFDYNFDGLRVTLTPFTL